MGKTFVPEHLRRGGNPEELTGLAYQHPEAYHDELSERALEREQGRERERAGGENAAGRGVTPVTERVPKTKAKLEEGCGDMNERED